MEEVRYCKFCGAYLPQGQKKCLACGLPIEVTKAGSDTDTIETTTLEDNTYTVYVDGVPQYDYRVNERENVLDLDTASEIKVKFCGVVRSACIAHKSIVPGMIYGGRTMDGRLQHHDSLEVRLLLQFK